MKRLLLFLLFSCCAAAQTYIYDGGPGPGTTFYVSPTGSNSNSGTLASPWLTPSYASTHVSAGNTVIFLNGTYTLPASGSFRGDWYINVSGTAGNPIVFKAQNLYGAKLVGSTPMADGMTIVGMFGSYITLMGFDITGTDGTGVTMAVDGTTDTNVVVTRNYVHDITTPCDSNGGTAIGTGSGNNYEVGNNHFTIDGNLIYNILDPVGCAPGTLHGAGVAAMLPFTTVSNNIIVNGGRWPIESWHAAHNMTYFGNTIINGQDGITMGAGDSGMVAGGNTGSLVQNNIVINQTVVAYQETGTGGSNTYKDNLSFTGVTTFSLYGTSTQTGTVHYDPQFLNNTGTATGNYNLRSGSTALTDGTVLAGILTDYSGVTRATSGAVPLGAEVTPCGYNSGTTSCFAGPGCLFTPTGGAYAGPQTVTMTPPSGAGYKCFYTVDGSTPSIAGKLYTGPIAIGATTTLRSVSAKVGVMVRDSELTNARWKCVLGSAHTYPSGVSCQAGGGTGSFLPSNIIWSFGSPMLETTSTTLTAGSAQALFINTTNNSACQDCSQLAEDKIVKVDKGKTFLENNEMDVNNSNLAIYNQFHTCSLQCNQQGSSPNWQVAPQVGPWVDTGISYGCPLSTTQQTEIRYTCHWTNGDTSCSGHSCDSDDSLTVCIGGSDGTGGVCKDFNLGPHIFPGNGTASSFGQNMAIQDQPDHTTVTAAGVNPATATRSVWHNNATLAYYGTSVFSSATYTIGPLHPTPPLTIGGTLQQGGHIKIQ